jgi:hypothetical protein
VVDSAVKILGRLKSLRTKLCLQSRLMFAAFLFAARLSALHASVCRCLHLRLCLWQCVCMFVPVYLCLYVWDEMGAHRRHRSLLQTWQS